MKPPHSNRPSGSGHGPSPRGSGQGQGRPFGGGAQRGPQQQSRPWGQGARDDRPRPDGPRSDGPRSDGPRPEGPRRDGPRPQGGTGQGKPFQGKPFQAKPFQAKPLHGKPLHGKPLQGRPNQGEHSGGAPRPFHAPRNDRPQQRPAQTADTPRGTIWLYGQHAVAAALANPARRLRRLVITEEAEANLTPRLPQPWPLQPERVDRGRLDQLLGRDVAHQGVALLADPLAPPSLQSVLERPGPLVVLDQVTDPRNVGAILRSAAAFAVAGVITQDRNAPEETGALAKAASGALESMPLLRAVNIARTLIALKAANCWVVGLDAEGKAPLSGPALGDRRIVLVLGAEGEGLRRLTRETCDELAALTMPGAMESLNVSAAAAVALYELARRA